MTKFLKSFGLGLLYAILSPILLCILLAYAVYGIYNFFVEGTKAIIRFFSGKPLFPRFEEDRKAEIMLNRGLDHFTEEEEEKAVPAPATAGTTNVYVQQNIYQTPPPETQNPSNPLPKIPSARIPDLPGIDPAAIEAANTQIEANPIPQPIEPEPLPNERQIASSIDTETIDIDD